MNSIGSVDQTISSRLLSTGLAGGIASFLTQPLEVIKTNRIHSPSVLYLDLHRRIVSGGWKMYMRGASLAVVRQAYGFTIYILVLEKMQKALSTKVPELNKYFNYTFSSVSSKFIAMIL